MIKTQVIQLMNAGNSHLKEANDPKNKMADKKTYTTLALSCFAEAREALKDSNINSLTVWSEFLILTGQSPVNPHEHYIEFTLRNQLDPLSLEDFQEFIRNLGN